MQSAKDTHTLDTVILDQARIQALQDTLLLDTKAEAAFDRLTNMAARILGAPVALISLIDVDRQFVKSGVGTDVQHLPLSHSFCKHVVATGEPLIVEDARQHPVVRHNPAIDDFDVIAYLGLPIRTNDGYNIGSLCVIDHEKRKWSQDEISIIQDLTGSVMMEIELRVQMRMEDAAGRKLSTTEVYGKVPNQENSFGVYEIVQKIGRGGMADVYLCKHRKIGNMVAVKQLSNRTGNRNDFLHRFQREVDIVTRLKHPNIIRVYGSGVKDDNPYMVMEYINGEDLQSFLKRNEKLTFMQDGAILLDIAEALDHAHAQGVIHRDVKPANVLLHRRFRDGKPLDQFYATLTDFGVARFARQRPGVTADNMIGTVNYTSPEQIMSEETLDYRADIYSFGVLAYRFLTGHLPFESDNVGTVINMHINTPVPDPRQYESSLTDGQVSALQQALAKNPDDRPQSARKFVAMLGT